MHQHHGPQEDKHASILQRCWRRHVATSSGGQCAAPGQGANTGASWTENLRGLAAPAAGDSTKRVCNTHRGGGEGGVMSEARTIVQPRLTCCHCAVLVRSSYPTTTTPNIRPYPLPTSHALLAPPIILTRTHALSLSVSHSFSPSFTKQAHTHTHTHNHLHSTTSNTT